MAFIQAGERMKLLNLWPKAQEVAHPQRRLLLEMFFALLAVVAILLCLWLWLDWRLRNVSHANQLLKAELMQLNQSRTVTLSSGTEMPRLMRLLLVGKLDWMGELPQWMMGNRVHWVSAKLNHGGLELVGVALDGEAINAMLEAVRARYANPPVQISKIADINIAGQTLWRFEMNVDARALHNKIELPTEVGVPLTHSNRVTSQSKASDSVGGLHE